MQIDESALRSLMDGTLGVPLSETFSGSPQVRPLRESACRGLAPFSQPFGLGYPFPVNSSRLFEATFAKYQHVKHSESGFGRYQHR